MIDRKIEMSLLCIARCIGDSPLQVKKIDCTLLQENNEPLYYSHGLKRIRKGLRRRHS